MRTRPRLAQYLSAAAFAACGAPAPVVVTDDPPTLALVVAPDAPRGGEALQCFGFDAAPLANRVVRAVRWELHSGPVALHHAGLYAVPAAIAAGPVPCDAVPTGATGLHIWAPGNDALVLPDDTGVLVPSGTRSLLVQTHALRTGDGPSAAVAVRVELHAAPPARVAAFAGVVGDVPTIPPHAAATGGARCRVAARAEALLLWPHMHRAGQQFRVAVVRPDGTRTALLAVAPWDFDAQRFYPASVTLEPGDALETECVWVNTTDAPIAPGPRTQDEMCNLGVLLTPAAAAHWEAPCD